MSKSISDLTEGESTVITSCNNLRLLEHGFVPKTSITVYKKFLGLTCVSLRGAIIACRDKDYQEVSVEEASYQNKISDGKN
ncbi:ferrous iron transport protein A [Candidatus Pacearchaeota archaeon]|nr:ferrous iron transport protein A [Candidatus Pacearchaeota archaeon]